MCGISAVYRYESLLDADILKMTAMNQEMYYRGPDDEGVWNDTHCAMAQVRLSIIGLTKGKQPLFNEDKTLVLICNGEIYNYLEIRNNLLSKGHVFSSDSDSETILHLYEEYGTDCLKHLRGMFAFCLWDSQKQQLFVARDRIGEKLLYYAHVPGGVVCSSELKAILKNYIHQPQVLLEQLAAPIRYTAPTSKSDTYIDQIKRIEPGQYLIINKTGIQKHRYWKRDHTDRFMGGLAEAKEETLRLMRESVDMCLRSDVPVAVMLSGGIDSSAIAALAKEKGREVHTITAGYKGNHSVDEREVAKRFAKEQGFIYHEVELDESDFKNCFNEFTEHIDEPITDSAALAQWALYKKVKSLGFKVLLGGMGGDELFYGYPYWNKLAESLRLHRQHQALFPWKGYNKKKKYLEFILKNWKYILYAGHPLKIADSSICYWMHADYKKFADKAYFLYGDQNHSFSDVNLYQAFGNTEPGKEIDIVYDFSFDNIMTMAYLYLADREGMGNSIEIRSPLLDYKLVEFVSSLPVEIKYNSDNPKYFLKEVLRGIVPDYILDAPKKGFTPPNDFIKEVVNSYQYKSIKSDYKFYNSILADRVLSLYINKK
ncbi:asparagine synthase (glutamine-hydrolyzing) [Spirosoma panaciterrae]|uniref:asparagine synthase (glutamine-hydrolyzing) n=1 Tax=Spirosoma panaciterrae TaxID=496058 RepID=UPI0003666F9F|nr:asparagine synthase (glutamine-hydrolyzing) [Spirosoma panaciterrae]